MSNSPRCLLKHMGVDSPIRAYRSAMVTDVEELVADGMDTDAAWLQVIDEKLANLRGEQTRIEQSVADAYAKTAAGQSEAKDNTQTQETNSNVSQGRTPGAQAKPAPEAGMNRLEVVSVYNTAGGKEAMRIKRLTGSDGRITYSWIGEYGAGSGRPFEAMRDEVALQKRAHRGMVLVSGAEFDSLQPAPTSGPIEDVGEKIGGARKDRWKDRGLDIADLDSMSESEGAELATKANVWKPDYEDISAASEPVTAAMVKVIYDQLAAKPKTDTPQGRRDYVKAMQAVRKVYGAVKTPDEARNAFDVLRGELGVTKRVGAGFAQTNDADAKRVLFSVYKGRSDPFVFGYNELARAKKLVQDGFPAKGEPWKTRFVIRAQMGENLTPRGVELTIADAAALGTPLTEAQAKTGHFRISDKKGKAHGYAASMPEAEALAKQLYEGSKAKNEKVEPDRPHLDKIKREGLDKTIDRDATPDDMLRDFGFRGIEWGNWAAQDERQRILNHAYDAMSDLATILNLPRKALSLNGTMGMAFGARGGGRFAAHYEPGKLVINMTKLRGSGSLAHEWAHAFDHYLGELEKVDAYQGKARGASGWYSEDQYTGKPRKRTEKVGGKWVNVERYRLENVRPELAAKIDAVMRALFEAQISKPAMLSELNAALEQTKDLVGREQDPNSKAHYERSVVGQEARIAEVQADTEDKTYSRGRSQYAKEAQKLSGKSSTGYWLRPTEMWARAFESYVFDKLQSMGAKSDYLVHGVEEERFANPEQYKGNPYPVGTERAAINKAFDAFIGELQTKETDKGIAVFEPSRAYSAREQDPYETDLFGNPLPAPAGKPRAGRAAAGRTENRPDPGTVLGDTAAPAGEYLTRTIVGVTGQRTVGASVVKTAADAAAATAYLGGSAVERFDGLLTDKNGKPLALIGGFKGALAQTSVYPATLVGEAMRVPGATNLWLSHNHPSGKSELSQADKYLNNTITDVFNGTGIEVRGILAIGDGRFSAVDQSGEPTAFEASIPASKGSSTVPAIERQVAVRGNEPALTSPAAAKDAAKAAYSKIGGPGILLMSSQHDVLGWVPVAGVMSGRLRGTGGLAAIYRAVSEANAGTAILVHGGELDALVGERQKAANNIASALAKIDVRTLDIINVKTGASAAERGETMFNGILLSQAQPFYSALSRAIEGVAMKQGTAGAWTQALKGMLASGKVKADEVEWSGLREWLEMQTGKVSKDDVLNYLQANGVQVQEVVLGAQSNAEADKAMEKWGIVVSRNPEDENQVAFLDRDNPDDLMTADELESAGYPIAAVRAAMEIESGGVAVGATGFPKHGQWVLPGGQNYREVLLTLPNMPGTQKVALKLDWVQTGDTLLTADLPTGNIASIVYDPEFPAGEVSLQILTRDAVEVGPEEVHPSIEAAKAAAAAMVKGQGQDIKGGFRSNHWAQPNVLAHIRVNDRTDAEGKRVLFVEELQSDWGQAAKKDGFAKPLDASDLDAYQQADNSWNINRISDRSFVTNVRGFAGDPEGAIAEAARRMGGQTGGVPRAPFVDKTDKWVALALKRIVKMAVDEGYDRVAFVNGEQSAERYDLSKQVRSIEWTGRGNDTEKQVTITPNSGNDIEFKVQPDGSVGGMGGGSTGNEFDGKRLDEIVGKDVAERILGETHGDMRGNGLKVGGTGMVAFYDKIVPAALKDVLKKVGGGQIGEVQIAKHEGIKFGDGSNAMLAQPGFDITPAMRSKAADGLPLFKSTASTTGTDPGKLTDMVANIRAGWADAPPVTVVATVLDLPIKLLTELRRANAMNTARALIIPNTGQVYLIADRLGSLADAQFVLFHEVLGHYGLRKFLGADYEKTMRQMRAMNAGLAAESRSWMAAYGPGQIEARVKRGMSYAEATVEVDLLSVEEALADRAGKPEQISGLKRLVAKLQAWLREHGFMEVAQWLEGKTQAQVLSLLQSARDAVEKAEGVHAYTEPAAALLSQADQTDTPAFKRWFGKSRVVDADGKPLVVYHGSGSLPASFSAEARPVRYGMDPGAVAFFTDDPANASGYANNRAAYLTTKTDGKRGVIYDGAAVAPVFLSFQNPLIVDAQGANFDSVPFEGKKRNRPSVEDISQIARERGYDSLIVKNVRDNTPGKNTTGTTYVAFRPEQIKSALGNSGAFDPSNPSILLSQIQQGNIPGTTDTEQEDIAKGYKARVKRALKRADGVINGLGELPDTEQYLGQRYLALGKIAAVDKIAGDIRAAFRKASQADKKEIYAYLTTAGANTDAIAEPETKTMAAKVKRYIGTVGDQLVARGLISEESREAYRDAYLPRLYLAHLLSDGDWRAIGAGKKVSDMGYLKARKDIPQEIRDVILGEVKDPAFLAATAIAKPMRDMALLDWLAQISENQQWVLANSMTEWQGKRVSVFWLKAEADALRTRARHYPEAANRTAANAVAERMDAAAVEAMDGADFNHKDYKQIPNQPKYGRLRGIYVRAEIYNDLMGAQEFLPSDPGWAMHLLGYGGLGTKATQLWKMSKVALNIPGQVRNAISNGVMLQLSGVPFHKLPILMGRAISQIRHGGRHWLVAKKYGVTESTFQAQEMFRARRDLLDLERDLKGLTPLVALKTVGAVIADAAGDAYQFTEALFKTVKIMDAMEREGMDEEAAAIEAQKWLFDYSLVDKNVRYLRNAPVGMPFLTYTTKVLPRLAEVALLHPQRFLPWVALMYGMQAWAQAMFGGDDDEWDELKKALPKWMQEKGHVAFLPWRDDAGRLQAVDMSYFFPWSQWAEFGSSLTEGDLKGAGKAMGLFGGPVTSVITAWATGEDSFTGRQIINEGDPTSYQAASLLAYTWDLMMPPMMGSSGVVSPMWLLDPQYGGKLAQASTGATNRMGDQKATYGQAASRIAGFNAYGIDPEVTRTSNLIGMKADIAKARAALRSKLGNQGLTPAQQKKLIEDYTAEMTERAKEMKKYAEESTVPEFAKRAKVTE